MNASELLSRAPYGALVSYTDGTPRPPERHKNKLHSWQSRNGSGYFVMAEPGPARFSLMTNHGKMNAGPVLVVNRMFTTDSELQFEAKPPAPGTILAYSEFRGRIEVKHVWPTLADAHAWAARFYKFEKCGLHYFIVTEKGELQPHMPQDQEAA